MIQAIKHRTVFHPKSFCHSPDTNDYKKLEENERQPIGRNENTWVARAQVAIPPTAPVLTSALPDLKISCPHRHFIDRQKMRTQLTLE